MRETEAVDLWAYEHAAFADGYRLVCGIDEAGRGPLAGPVCAAAVILPPDCRIEGLNDSKKLTDKRRRELYDVIVENAVAYGIAFASHQEIDEINILQATFLAMRRAMANRDPQDVTSEIIDNLAHTRTNKDFIQVIKKVLMD